MQRKRQRGQGTARTSRRRRRRRIGHLGPEIGIRKCAGIAPEAPRDVDTHTPPLFVTI